ncbi:MAG: hypothetical protein L0Y56_12950 [Nitrospira sp.]|nr:hypothetical protein [Nitrospira sp.]
MQKNGGYGLEHVYSHTPPQDDQSGVDIASEKCVDAVGEMVETKPQWIPNPVR